MSGLWGRAKKAAQKAKLRGEITLLERESNTRKKEFGIDLYDMMTNDKNKLLGVSAGTLFKNQQKEIKEPFERAKDDIAGIQARKDVKQKDLDILEVKGANTLPDQTVNQKMKQARRSISNAANGTKLQASMAMLDREMKIRKEQFGVEVFDLTRTSEEKKKKGIKGAIKNAISNMSDQEKEIQACIDKAKKDVGVIEGRIHSKKNQIGLLDEEMAPLTSS